MLGGLCTSFIVSLTNRSENFFVASVSLILFVDQAVFGFNTAVSAGMGIARDCRECPRSPHKRKGVKP